MSSPGNCQGWDFFHSLSCRGKTEDRENYQFYCSSAEVSVSCGDRDILVLMVHFTNVLKILRWKWRRVALFKYKHVFKDLGAQGNKLFAQVHKICLQQELRHDSASLTTLSISEGIPLSSTSLSPVSPLNPRSSVLKREICTDRKLAGCWLHCVSLTVFYGLHQRQYKN